ncbi:hypothetical protein B0T24DRAFT_600250 [Lasiosphaeria ovina]|uniref:Myb/SANT-like domain-containing protein n=1 Tax=Lasiosphaeria ovina TaxID=92902 RepID=A0AAE0MXX6_9PEZI|nr:hypothetical protein B0T24DRAFT_600250 [Lasiosphaeria ovina]
MSHSTARVKAQMAISNDDLAVFMPPPPPPPPPGHPRLLPLPWMRQLDVLPPPPPPGPPRLLPLPKGMLQQNGLPSPSPSPSPPGPPRLLPLPKGMLQQNGLPSPSHSPSPLPVVWPSWPGSAAGGHHRHHHHHHAPPPPPPAVGVHPLPLSHMVEHGPYPPPWTWVAGGHHHGPPPLPAAGDAASASASPPTHTEIRPGPCNPHPHPPPPPPPPQCAHGKWPAEVKRIILQTMCQCVDIGLRPKTSFRRLAYRRAVRAVSSRAGLEITEEEVKGLLKVQRRKFRVWEDLGEAKGVVWDDSLQQWTLGPAEWDELIAEDGEMSQFRGRTLQWPDLLEKLWGGPYRVFPLRQRRKSSSSSSK